MGVDQFSRTFSEFFPRYCSGSFAGDFHTFAVSQPIKILHFLRDSHFFQFKQLWDMWAVDYPKHDLRFQLTYYLLSFRFTLRVAVRFVFSSKIPVPTSSELFPASVWLEREIWDMYGIFFSGHPDLRRLLTDYGFSGHPLRKDFPLSGYSQLRYDDEAKQIVSESVSFSQEYRYFDFLNPWSK